MTELVTALRVLVSEGCGEFEVVSSEEAWFVDVSEPRVIGLTKDGRETGEAEADVLVVAL